MRTVLPHFFAFACGAFALTANAQESWRSILYPDDWHAPVRENGLAFAKDKFLQDFSYAGYQKGEAPLSLDGLDVYNVVEDFGADPTGETDSTNAIQSAINAAANGGGVIFLPDGQFRLSVPEGEDRCLQIESSNTILRGAGVDRTFLFNTTTEMRNAEVIRVRPPDWGSWTTERSDPMLTVRDELGPTRFLELQSVDGYSIGDWIVIHNPATREFVEDLKMGLGVDGVDWTSSLESLRGIRFLRQIVAIDEETNTIEIDIPTRWFLKTRDGARIYKTASHLENVALEDFSIGNHRIEGRGWEESDFTDPERGAYLAHDSYLIEFRGVVNGWIQRLNSYNPKNNNGTHCLSNAVKLEWCRNVTLYNLKLQNSQYGGGGGNGYMIRLNAANECLVVECEVGFSRHGIVMWRMENSGNVVTRCYDHDTGVQLGDMEIVRTAGRGSDHHGAFSHSNLFDGNLLERAYLEAAYRGDWGSNPDHGLTASQCVFWNTKGLEYHQDISYIVHSQQFGQGYVIGTQGAADRVELKEKRTGSAKRSNPIDFTEGIGEGETLEPQSLYQSQLLRRVGPLDPNFL